MRWLRFTLFLAVLGVAGCMSTAGPQYPQDDENSTETGEKNKGGMVSTDHQGFFV
jgi:hypothetical protein